MIHQSLDFVSSAIDVSLNESDFTESTESGAIRDFIQDTRNAITNTLQPLTNIGESNRGLNIRDALVEEVKWSREDPTEESEELKDLGRVLVDISYAPEVQDFYQTIASWYLNYLDQKFRNVDHIGGMLSVVLWYETHATARDDSIVGWECILNTNEAEQVISYMEGANVDLDTETIPIRRQFHVRNIESRGVAGYSSPPHTRDMLSPRDNGPPGISKYDELMGEEMPTFEWSEVQPGEVSRW